MDNSNGDWTVNGIALENFSHPGSTREEYAPSFRPRGFFPVDPFHRFFAAPPRHGNYPVAHPPSTSQHVSAQATFRPTVSAAPSGPSVVTPASLRTLPPHHPGWSPTPLSYSPYDPRLAMSFAPPGRLDIQPVSVSRASPDGYVQPLASYSTIPALRQDRISDVPLNVYPPPRPPVRKWLCPLCGEPYRRPQDRNRHIPSHLPYWICCSHDRCSWRGYRLDTFRKHWHSEHQSTGRMPDESGSTLYDPGPLVEGIVRGSVSVGAAENWAVTMIKKIAVTLDKQGLLTDPWGRKEKNLKGQAKGSWR